MRKSLLFVALLFGIAALAIAGWGPDTKIHFVEFQDANGTRHLFPLGKAVAQSDALGLRSEIMAVAQQQHAKGNASFLDAHWGPQMSGSLCYITSRSGGRVYYCGQCGGLGCMGIQIIN